MLAVVETAALLLISLAGLALPFGLVNHPWLLSCSGFLLSIGNTFSGGVMLAVGMMHMLPDAMEALHSTTPNASFVGCALATTGVMLPLFLEKSGFLFVLLSRFQKAKPTAACSKHEPLLESGSQEEHTEERAQDDLPYKLLSFRYIWAASRRYAVRQLVYAPLHRSSEHAPQSSIDTCVQESLDKANSWSWLPSREHLNFRTVITRRDGALLALVTGGIPPDWQDKQTGVCYCYCRTHPTREDKTTFGRTADILMFAVLSVHAAFAGLALGVSSGETANSILVALLLHKLFEAVALGVSISKSGRSTTTMVIEAAAFALATPIGILLGSHLRLPAATAGYIVGLSAGTFIYIALVEILPEEFGDDKDGDGNHAQASGARVLDSERAGLLKFIAWTFGVVCMGVLGLFT
ncbi:hypothetical protein AB1Y20_006748 [Prymnesium parvum]|uniref:Zinc/iron permease n=1 Tax=Prymnesium parvum TaxID=97485 RepID=A0AB34J1J4_PRYPA